MAPNREGLRPSGIEGLDFVLLGGFPPNAFFLVQGEPGSGKTTLAIEIAVHHVTAGARCLYISLTEPRRDLESTCRAHGWTLEGIDVLDLTQGGDKFGALGEASVFSPADTELTDLTEQIKQEVERSSPRLVVFDGLAELRLLAGDSLRYRRHLLAMKAYFAEAGATTLLLDDRTAGFPDFRPESLVGGCIVLERELPLYGRTRRRMHVTKLRGGAFREGYHDYDIVRGGVRIYPRLVAGDEAVRPAHERRSTGVRELDLLFGGGLAAGSTTLFLGPAGTGKSTVAMQIAVHGLSQGRKAAIYAFDEVRHILLERSEKLCVRTQGGLSSYLDAGLIHVQQVDPAELTPGAFAQEVKRAVDAGAETIIIDSVNGYLNAMPDERFLATHLHELFAYLNQRGVVTIMMVAQHGMTVGAPVGGLDVSYLADTVLLFRYYEAEAELRKAISVMKQRTGAHERTIRSLVVGEGGVQVGPPLRGLHGIMTGVPELVPDHGRGHALQAETPSPR